jgi:hypothetical protein
MINWLASETLNNAIDTISKIVQVVAILIAGWWAYKTFFWSVKPGLDFRGGVDTALTWTKSDTENCQGSLNVTVSNDGMSAFDVSKIVVRGWLYTSAPPAAGSKQVSIDVPTPDHPVLVDYKKIESNEPFYTATYSRTHDGTGLIGHYPPGSKFNESWDWVFKKAKGQAVVFNVDATTLAGNTLGYGALE